MTFKDTDKILVNRDGVDYQADIGPLMGGGGGGAAGPQYTKADGSWRIDYKINGSFHYGHGNGMGKYVDGTVLDIDDSVWVLVGTHEMHKMMSEHNLKVEIGLSHHPDAENMANFREAFQVSRYVPNSITYCPDSKQLVWLQYKLASQGKVKEVWTSTYDPSLSTVDDTGLSRPVKLKEGNVGTTVYSYRTERHGDTVDRVGVWEFESSNFTVFDIEVGGTLVESITQKINQANEILEVCDIEVVNIDLHGDATKFANAVTGSAYYRDSYTNRHLGILKMSLEYWDDPVRIEAIDLEIDLNEHPILASASFSKVMMVTFKTFSMINPAALNNGYLVSRNPHSTSNTHLPKIAKIGNYYVCNVSHYVQFNFYGKTGDGAREEELAMTNSTPVMSLRTPLGKEAALVITNGGWGGTGPSRGCWFTEDSESYESCRPVAGKSIEDGMIVVDHRLAHGQRYYFAEEFGGGDIVALSSQCHRT